MKKEVIGTILALFTAIISGFAIFANKIFVINLDPTVFTAIRALIIGLVFLALSLVFGSWNKKENKKIQWKYLIFIGLIGGGLAFLLFFTGLQLTTAGRAGFLHKTLPFFVIMFSIIFLNEKITKTQWYSFFIMFAGIGFLTLSPLSPGELWQNPQLGDALIILATILWAAENVTAKKAMRKGEHNFVVSFARMFFGAIFLFGVVLFTSKINLIFSLTLTQWIYILASTAILFFYILTYYWAIKYINVSKAATILLLAPVITLFLGKIFLNEPISITQGIGSLLILIGAYFISKTKSSFSRI